MNRLLTIHVNIIIGTTMVAENKPEKNTRIKFARFWRPLTNWREKAMTNADKYGYRVVWSEEDGEFVGLCAEFPSLPWLAQKQVDALEGIVNLVSDTLSDMQENGEIIPEPLSQRRFSGRFVVRTTAMTHRNLALQAAEAGVSLNRYVNSVLAAAQ